MYYIVYKTTNTINNKIYIGIHKCKTLEFDEYYGSGILLLRSIRKYGIENFKRETLHICETWDDARILEKNIVTEIFCHRNDTYNISVGGTGGNTLAGYSEKERREIYNKIGNTNRERGNYNYIGIDLIKKQDHMRHIRIQPKNKGRKHVGIGLENIQKAGRKRKFKKYKWITDGINNRMLGEFDELPENWKYGKSSKTKFQKHTSESKRKISDAIKNDVCYNDGKVNLKLKKGMIPPPGFIRGMLQKHVDYKWITDGEDTARLPLEQELPKGWKYGRTIKKKK